MRLSVASCGRCTAAVFRPEPFRRVLTATAEAVLADMGVRKGTHGLAKYLRPVQPAQVVSRDE